MRKLVSRHGNQKISLDEPAVEVSLCQQGSESQTYTLLIQPRKANGFKAGGARISIDDLDQLEEIYDGIGQLLSAERRRQHGTRRG